MEFINLIKDVGIVAFVVVYMMKHQEERDKHMMKQQEKKDAFMMESNQKLLQTNADLANSVTIIVDDNKETKHKVENIENMVVKIADKVGVANNG